MSEEKPDFELRYHAVEEVLVVPGTTTDHLAFLLEAIPTRFSPGIRALTIDIHGIPTGWHARIIYDITPHPNVSTLPTYTTETHVYQPPPVRPPPYDGPSLGPYMKPYQ